MVSILSLVSKLLFPTFEFIFIFIWGSFGLKGLMPLFKDWAWILIFKLESSFDKLGLIVVNILGFVWVFLAESALYTSPSIIMSFSVFKFWGLFWVPKAADGISEFWVSGLVIIFVIFVVMVWLEGGINEILFFRNVSWALFVLPNNGLMFLSWNKLILFSKLFLLESTFWNNFWLKIDDCTWLLELSSLLLNRLLVNIDSFFSSFFSGFSIFCSSFISLSSSSLISPGSISILFSFSLLSLFSTYPNFIILSTNFKFSSFLGVDFISPLSFIFCVSLNPNWILISFWFWLLSLSFSFFCSIIILFPVSLDLSTESLMLELLLILFWFKLTFELFTPKVKLESDMVDL